jgi:bacterioferritin
LPESFDGDTRGTRQNSQWRLRRRREENARAGAPPYASYSELVRWLGNDDPTTRRMIEDILKMEEQHADDMANLLAKVG